MGRGVLQGDCLSPLTFNLCFNTFIRYISDQKFRQFGFTINSLYPLHWFQFADDAAVITGLENENQTLLNHFTRSCINHELTSQGFIMSSILKLSNYKTRGLWSTVQQNMPKNIFNFMIKYVNNTLATRKNLFKWSLSDSPSCSFCLHPETLQHVVSSCRSYLEDGRYTWRHNSVLLFIAKSFSSIQH